MAVRTLFRENIQAALAVALGIEFVGGRIDGPVEDRDIGCVWWDSKTPAGNVSEEVNTYGVRVFKLWARPNQGMTTAENVVPLENTAEALEVALNTVLAIEGHWFFTVTEVRADYDGQFVEATLTAYDANRSDVGG
jgi:hypothetical protein